jgi:hypothetical protein
MRFSIRDLFWVILVVAISLGWWVDSSRLRMERDDYRNAAEANAETAIKNFEAYKQSQVDSRNP